MRRSLACYLLMEVGSAIDDDGLPGDKGAVVAQQEHHRTGDIFGALIALERPGRYGDLAEEAHLLFVLLHGIAQGKSGRHSIDQDIRIPEFLRQSTGEGDDSPFAGNVMEQEWGALKGCAGRNIDNAPAALFAHAGHDGPRTEEEATDIHREHSVPLFVRYLFKRFQRQGSVNTGIVDQAID